MWPHTSTMRTVNETADDWPSHIPPGVYGVVDGVLVSAVRRPCRNAFQEWCRDNPYGVTNAHRKEHHEAENRIDTQRR